MQIFEGAPFVERGHVFALDVFVEGADLGLLVRHVFDFSRNGRFSRQLRRAEAALAVDDPEGAVRQRHDQNRRFDIQPADALGELLKTLVGHFPARVLRIGDDTIQRQRRDVRGERCGRIAGRGRHGDSRRLGCRNKGCRSRSVFEFSRVAFHSVSFVKG